MTSKQIAAFIFLSIYWGFSGQAQNPVRILSYNTYNGFQSDTAIRNQYITWVGGKNPDIIAYQEMNRFTAESLKAFSERYGHPYSVLLKEKGYPVALSSRYPITEVQRVTENMHHGYLYARILDLHLFVVHLSPADRLIRKKELEIILAHATSLSKKSKILILGDFNAFSGQDRENYGEDLLQALATRDSTYHQNNLDNGLFDYQAIEVLHRARYKDTYRKIHQQYRFSMPTLKYRTRPVRRIDYIWANEMAARKVRSADILIDEDTEEMSDHYPLYIELKR